MQHRHKIRYVTWSHQVFLVFQHQKTHSGDSGDQVLATVISLMALLLCSHLIECHEEQLQIFLTGHPWGRINFNSISMLFLRDNVQLKHKCDHLMHCTRVSLGQSHWQETQIQIQLWYVVARSPLLDFRKFRTLIWNLKTQKILKWS